MISLGKLKERFEERYNQFVSKSKYLDPKANRLSDVGDPEERLRKSGYSLAYHRYFEGYAEKKVVGPDGKTRIERTYVGDAHRHRMTDSQWVGLKIGYALCYLIAAVLYVAGTAQEIASNFTWYVQVAEAMGFLSIFALLYCLICYLTSKRLLDTHSYRLNTGFFKTLCLISAGTTLLAALLQIPAILLNGGFSSPKSIATCVMLFLPPVLLFVMWYVETKKVRYEKILGKDTPYDAVNL